MKLASLTGSILVALLTATPSAYAKENTIVFKQLAGPASEMEQMRAPDPAAGAIHSKAALIPVEFSPTAGGKFAWQGPLSVERGDLRMMVFSDPGSNWQVDLQSPAGNQLKASSLARETRRSEFGMQGASIPGDLYGFDGIEPGHWGLKIQGDSNSRGFVLIEGDPAIELSSYQTHKRQLVGEQIGVAALLTSEGSKHQVNLGKEAGRIDSAVLRVTYPDGAIAKIAMFDDGRNGDGAAGDGVYGGSFAAKAAGDYVAQVIVSGTNLAGAPLLRTAEHLIPVIESSLAIGNAAGSVKAARSDEARLLLNIPVTAAMSDQHYRAIGEVWGHDAAGKAMPVAWIGGMVKPENGVVGLALDEHWIALAKANGPFELRDLRIEDPDNFITVASAKRIALDLPALSVRKSASEISVDERMLMGPRPAETAQAKGVGKRLILVHGYCSGGVWPAAQFSTASTFLDANQNRTHDDFARRIRDYGATWNSFGTVAHSQGGAASLHLYTYYWSGLDNATGSRLIQSVGTPYQGTNLAGILATLGSWFGVGCGNNANLNYSGASSWLAGIPTWARGKVNYYTTSFKLTNWYTNDYCNFATDLVLSDPEDGTTEKAYGQLSSGLNRGHVTGQCHTAGMRDPAQYLNASRNSTMNTNAAR